MWGCQLCKLETAVQFRQRDYFIFFKKILEKHLTEWKRSAIIKIPHFFTEYEKIRSPIKWKWWKIVTAWMIGHSAECRMAFCYSRQTMRFDFVNFHEISGYLSYKTSGKDNASWKLNINTKLLKCADYATGTVFRLTIQCGANVLVKHKEMNH